jgi:hypothetical protein
MTEYLNPFPLTDAHIGLLYETKDKQLVEVVGRKKDINQHKTHLTPSWLVRPYPVSNDKLYEVNSQGYGWMGLELQWYSPVDVRPLSTLEAIILSMNYNVVINSRGQRIRFYNNAWREVSNSGGCSYHKYYNFFTNDGEQLYLWNCGKVQISKAVKAKLKKILRGNYA